jgi:hypothetical protein
MISEDQLNDTFGNPREKWESAKLEARRILHARAKATQLIEYGELAQQISSIHFDPHGSEFRKFLGQLSWEEDISGRGMITAIVVHKSDRLPGGGFFLLAQRLGRDVSDQLKFCSAEVERVFSDFR